MKLACGRAARPQRRQIWGLISARLIMRNLLATAALLTALQSIGAGDLSLRYRDMIAPNKPGIGLTMVYTI